MPARRAGRVVAAACAVALALAGCSGDDDDAGATTTPTTPAVTEPPATTAPVATTAPPTTPPTTEPTPTTLDEEALKAQIAEDFLRAEQEREDLLRNPTLDNLEERVGTQIAAPGSTNYIELVEFVRGMVERGERVVPGTPDYSEVTVESVELIDETHAVVTACYVLNSARIDPSGKALEGTGVLVALRTQQPVDRTDHGWLPSEATIGLQSAQGATTCPPE